jgi:hypothetical protein
MKPEQPVLHLEIRTVRTLPADGLRATCATKTVRDLQADGPQNLLQQNPNTSKDPRTNSQELDEHATNTRVADGPRATGGLLTVKIRQPSYEFTFGVGITFVSYPLVLTPVV